MAVLVDEVCRWLGAGQEEICSVGVKYTGACESWQGRWCGHWEGPEVVGFNLSQRGAGWLCWQVLLALLMGSCQGTALLTCGTVCCAGFVQPAVLPCVSVLFSSSHLFLLWPLGYLPEHTGPALSHCEKLRDPGQFTLPQVMSGSDCPLGLGSVA